MKKSKNTEENPAATPAADLQDQAGQKTTNADAAVRPAAADEQSAAKETDPCQVLKENLAVKEKDFAALSDQYLRLMAEYDNFRKRSQKEKDALYGESIVMVIKEWLPVLDSIDLAELAAGKYDNEDARHIAAGLVKIQKQVDEVLERLGVQTIPCCGQTFDPMLHEAVMHVEDDSVGPSVVVEEFQKGYRRDERVIRHSVVKVAN